MFTDGNTIVYDYAPDGRKFSVKHSYATDGIVVLLSVRFFFSVIDANQHFFSLFAVRSIFAEG